MKLVLPEIYVIGRPALDWSQLIPYLESVGAHEWGNGKDADAQTLIEVAGRNCYKSWEPGLNKNVTQIRADQGQYLRNILASGHGSVLEHATYNLAFNNVSRVFTHEVVRHRVGTAISQESLRYVRLEDLDFWMPEWALQDEEFMFKATELIRQMEYFQIWMGAHFKLDKLPFSQKKEKTSFMRRFAPEGLATRMIWSANVRTLRHVIEMRTPMSAEEEMRLVARAIGNVMVKEAPLLFGDYHQNELGDWVTDFKKV